MHPSLTANAAMTMALMALNADLARTPLSSGDDCKAYMPGTFTPTANAFLAMMNDLGMLKRDEAYIHPLTINLTEDAAASTPSWQVWRNSYKDDNIALVPPALVSMRLTKPRARPVPGNPNVHMLITHEVGLKLIRTR